MSETSGRISLVQRLLREKALGRYLNALEQGDIATIISVLEQAERDVILERMILELHESYQTEEEFLALVQEESQMEIEGIHKSYPKGQADEPQPEELAPEAPAPRKRRQPPRWLQVLAAVLLVCLIVSGFLLIRNARSTFNAAAYQKWCNVPLDNDLASVRTITALSPTDAWILAEPMSGYSSVFERWNGSQWKLVEAAPVSASAGSGIESISNTLEDMHALSPDNIWAVGYTHVLDAASAPSGTNHTLIEHWDGARWQVIKSPDLYSTTWANNGLYSISGSSPNDLWAYGQAFASAPTTQQDYAKATPLLEHWDGHEWSIVSLVSVIKQGAITALAAVSAQDVWLNVFTQENGKAKYSFLHWDGQTWQEVSVPASFGENWHINELAAFSADDVWGFGANYDTQHPDGWSFLIHWDGQKWSSFSLPQVDSTGSALAAPVVAQNSHDIWVSMTTGSSNTAGQPFLAHWDGQNWQLITLPAVRGGAYVNGLAVAGEKVTVLLSSYSPQTGQTSTLKENC